MKIKLLVIFALFPFIGHALATWNGPATIDAAAYNNSSYWLPTVVPNAATGIVFNTAVTITTNIGIGSGNSITISSTGALTINSGVTVNAMDISIDGPGGSLTNNGVLNAHNFSYGNTAGATVVNNGNMQLNNLNIGSGTHSGIFTNNDSLSITQNIVVEDGTFDNNPGAYSRSNGIDVKNGGIALNGGAMNSSGATSSSKVIVEMGGKFINEGGSHLVIDLSIGNVPALDISDTFTNLGTIFIGNNPVNTQSQGVIVRNTGDFSNTGAMTFQIDPSNCVFVYPNANSFSTVPVTIISGKSCGIPLPITLVSFNGIISSDGNVVLKWAVGQEQDMLLFNVEQSTDGVNFNTIASVPVQDDVNDYSASLKQTFLSAYYRLNMIDLNGNHDYSNIINIKSRLDETIGYSKVRVYPNPVGNQLQITLQETENAGSYELLDVLGRIVQRGVLGANSNNVVNTGNIAAGVYSLKVLVDGTVQLRQLHFVK